MMLLQLSSAQGPAECELAVSRAWRRLEQEAAAAGVSVTLLEHEPGDRAGLVRSVLLELEGAQSASLAEAWQGTFLWIFASPFRPHHGRKNWYFGGAVFAPPAPVPSGDIVYEALRASGPGGQHVNKTDSAIRATHVASGITVKVQSERSQHANRRVAALLIARRLSERVQDDSHRLRASRRHAHHELVRGQPKRTFRGERFDPA